MTHAREQILESIRKALGRDIMSQARTMNVDERLANPPRHLRPNFHEPLKERFIERLQAAAGTLEYVSTLDDVPATVADYLELHGLPRRLIAAPALAPLWWPVDIEVQFGASQGNDLVSVTPCFAAVAETGSLVLLSGPESPTTLNFLPENHIIVLKTGQIVRHIEDTWNRLRERPEGMPRTVNFITGPSRTADVEQTLQLGAHGPRRLHVIVVEA